MSSTLGRNVTFRQSPIPQHRLGRFKTGEVVLPQGAPVQAAGDVDPMDGRRVLEAAPTGAPIVGRSGILVHEEAWRGFDGSDPVLQRPSDLTHVPAHTQAQLVHGTEVKFLVQNTPEDDFEDQRVYEEAVMFNPAALATASLDDGVVPRPGGADGQGWWTTGASNPWGHIIELDKDYGLVVFQLTF